MLTLFDSSIQYEPMTHLLQHLKRMGLSDREGRAYLALLELGQATAYAIAKKSGMKRPTTYLVLDELLKKGLALKIPKAKNQIFIAKSPQEFFAEEEARLLETRAALPELMMIARAAKSTSHISYYEGDKQIEEALAFRLGDLKQKELLCFYGTSEKEISDRIAKRFHERDVALNRQHTRVRAFAPRDPKIKKFRHDDKKFNRDVVELPLNEYSASVSLEIADYFVKAILHADKQAIVIENKRFASAMKQLFEMLWVAKS